METMKRDPKYIADQLRLLRKMLGLTQENLAEAANLSTRTIEKAESGRHYPDEQTLRSIARATGFEVRVFDKPSPEEEARQKAEMERAQRKMVLVPTVPIRTASQFLGAFDQRHAFRIDMSAVTDNEALETAAAMADWVKDLNDVWVDCPMSQRLEYARIFADLCQQIEQHGYLCYIGHHRQRLREKDRPDLVFVVGLMSIQTKKDAEGERFALVQLDGAWETLEADRPKL